MKSLVVAAASSAVLVGAVSVVYLDARPADTAKPRVTATPPRYGHAPLPPRASSVSNEALTAVVKQTCAATCHSERQKAGNLVLAGFDVDRKSVV